MGRYVIYMHRNKINNKIYIGQTCQNPQRRWGINGKNYKTSPYFWSAIQNYGWENFEHIILETHLTHEEANKRESFYIKLYKTNLKEFGYNLTSGGSHGRPNEETIQKLKVSHQGRKHTEEQKKKIRENGKGKHTGENSPVAKKVQANTGEIFNTIIEAALWCGLKSQGNISSCCKGERKSAGKHPVSGERLIWHFLEEEK